MDKNTVVKELKKGAYSWNNWRKKQALGELNLDGVELVGLDLNNIDLSKLSMRGATIKNCNLRHADFISTNLAGSDLRNNDLTSAKLIAARLNEANLSGSVMANTNMLTASTRDAKLENINFQGHDMRGLNLKNISLAGSNLVGQNLSKVDLSNTNLQNANLAKTDLSGTNLSGATLTNANFEGANLTGASFRASDLVGIDLSGMDLTECDFSGADMSNCDLREANLTRANLSQAIINGARLWKAQTQGWNISNICCTHACWDKLGKEKKPYRNNGFERIFAELITVELRYHTRLFTNELIQLPIFIEHLQAVHWGTILRLKSITDNAGAAVVTIVVEEPGLHNLSELKISLQSEADRILAAQVSSRSDANLYRELKEKVAVIKEEFWPRLLELAADHEKDQVRNLTVLLMDLKGFSSWGNDELSDKLALFRGLVKPIITKWNGNYPNMEGDSVRVTFRNASAGLACACMMRNILSAAGFELRIGVELGEVTVIQNEVTETTDLEGVAVSMAARLEAAAEAGEVLVSHNIRHYTGHREMFEFMPKRVQLKKGIGDKKMGDFVDCFAVSAKTDLQELF